MPRSLPAAALLGVVTVLALLFPPGARAQNVVPDGRFDEGLAGFAVGTSGTLAYDSTIDLEDDATSGSLSLTDDGALAAIAVAKRCIPGVLSPGDYYLEFWLRFAGGQTANGSAQLVFRTFPSSDCSGTPSKAFAPSSVKPSAGRGLWLGIRSGSITEAAGTVPQGVFSLGVYLSLNRTTEPNGSLTVALDDVWLAPVGKPLCQGLVPTIGGTDARDTIFGTSEADVIVTFGGNDEVHAGGGNDFVCAGRGNDLVYGDDGQDGLFGQGGADQLYGGEQRDVLKGGPGNDYLDGGGSNDVCVGGGGGNDDAAASCEKVKKTP